MMAHFEDGGCDFILLPPHINPLYTMSPRTLSLSLIGDFSTRRAGSDVSGEANVPEKL